MNLSFLYFLAQPWFVLPWYGLGALGVWFAVYDIRNNNTALKPAMQWAWPIIIFFFSVIGLVLYFATARPPHIGRLRTQDERKQALNQYEESMWRRVNGAVIHCVAGDGFGIMTAMIIARSSGMNFWQEFWFEYIVGFVIGWLIFQRKSMTMMTDSLPKKLLMAFRGEFFSMLTVMGGMGAVMTYVTPLVVTAQPKPLTYAFWGFGMLGLLVGYVFTFPMNWMMVKLGWKHGMGGMEGAQKNQIKRIPFKFSTAATMIILGGFGLFVPAWLTYLRQIASIQQQTRPSSLSVRVTGDSLFRGARDSIQQAIDNLHRGNQTRAALAMDDAFRATEVGTYSAPGSFYSSFEQIRNARLALNQGQIAQTLDHLNKALKTAKPTKNTTPPFLNLDQYTGAKVINQKGAVIGEVESTSGNILEISLGGWRDAWGFVDFSGNIKEKVPQYVGAFGPPKAIGQKLVMIPALG